MDTSIRLRLLNMGKATKVKPLNDDMACELGAELLGETLIFTVGALIIWNEYRRSANKEQKREDTQFERIKELEDQVTELALNVERQSAEIREFTRLVHAHGVNEKYLPSKIVDKKSGTVLTIDRKS